MIKVEVKSTHIDSFSGISKKSGQPFNIRNQEAFAFTYDANGVMYPYPQLIKIGLEDEQLPFSVGTYQINPQCIYIDKFGRLAMGRLSLSPVQISQRAAA